MRTLWRISNFADLSGRGGEKNSSRWSRRGRRVVYLSESPAGAMLEILANIQFVDGELPLFYQLLEISAEDNVPSVALPIFDKWKESQELTQAIGDAWLASHETSLARIPSAILPKTWNWLLNPLHPESAQIKIISSTRERFDNRLFQFGSR